MSGLFGLLNFGGIGTDVLSVLLPTWLTTVTHAIYFTSGAFMLWGIGTGRPYLEGPGLILLISSSIIRSFAIAVFAPEVGISRILVSFLFQLLVVISASIRLWSVVRRDVILKARNGS